jgi:hypothetical protein
MASTWSSRSSGSAIAHPRDGDAFLHHARDELARALDLHHRPIGDVRDGGQRVVGAVRDEFDPLDGFNVVGDRDRDIGGPERTD